MTAPPPVTPPELELELESVGKAYPSMAMMKWSSTCPVAAGMVTLQAADDDALRGLIDALLENPDLVRDMLLVSRASLSTSH